jgi:hypothetical protein
MAKKKTIFTVTEDLSGLFSEKPQEVGARTASKTKTANRSNERGTDRFTIEKALAAVTRQMEISGNRPRTISDYTTYVNHFVDTVKAEYVDDSLRCLPLCLLDAKTYALSNHYQSSETRMPLSTLGE